MNLDDLRHSLYFNVTEEIFLVIKKPILAGVATLTLVGTTLVAAEAFAKRGNEGHGERMTLLERLDSNGDGVLTIDEFSASNLDRAERGFNRKDADDDGLLSLDEFSTASGRRGRANLAEFDEDALKLCMEEILGYAMPDRPDSATVFAKADTNGDEALDIEEFLAASDLRAAERFAEIDSGADGVLTSEEIDADQALRQDRREVHKTCAAEQLEEGNLLN